MNFLASHSAVLVVLMVLPAFAAEFHPPRQVMAAGKPIDVQRIAHSAPFVGDFDLDGLDC